MSMRWGLGPTTLFLGWVVTGACTLPRNPVAHRGIDRKPPAPVGRPVNPWVRPDDLADGSSVDPSADPCGPRTGRDAQGKCERLRAESWGLGERVLLPQGDVILGAVPQAYLGGPGSEQTPIIRYLHHALTKVSIDSFWIDVVEVQRQDYQACVEAGACTKAKCSNGAVGIPKAFSKEGTSVLDGLPQTCVSYEQAQNYCRFREGSLPTLAQWTYAARGPELRDYSWGRAYDDSISLTALPVRLQHDSSYFGIRGLSGSVREIIAGTPQIDQALSPWVSRSFRSKHGPYLKHLRAWQKSLRCSKRKGACAKVEARARHWVSGIRVGATTWAWSLSEEKLSLDRGLNRKNALTFPSESIGFRCVYPRRDNDPLLSLTRMPLNPPESLSATNLSLFVGVAEAVNLSEARAYCDAVTLRSDKDRKDAGKWRLPTHTELLLVQDHRLGPGPLWTADGKAVKAVLAEDGTVERWETVAAEPKTSAMLARCVR